MREKNDKILVNTVEVEANAQKTLKIFGPLNCSINRSEQVFPSTDNDDNDGSLHTHL